MPPLQSGIRRLPLQIFSYACGPKAEVPVIPFETSHSWASISKDRIQDEFSWMWARNKWKPSRMITCTIGWALLCPVGGCPSSYRGPTGQSRDLWTIHTHSRVQRRYFTGFAYSCFSYTPHCYQNHFLTPPHPLFFILPACYITGWGLPLWLFSILLIWSVPLMGVNSPTPTASHLDASWRRSHHPC